MEVVGVFEGHCEPSFVPFILLKGFFLKEELEGRGRNYERGDWGGGVVCENSKQIGKR